MNKDELKKLLKQIQDEETETEEEVVEDEEEETQEEEEDTQDAESSTVEASARIEKMVEQLGERIAKAVVESAGGRKSEEENLKHQFVKSQQHGLNAIEYPSDLKSLDKDQKIVTFFKSLVYSHNDAESQRVLRALVEGTDADGGYLVPEEFSTEVFRILPDISVMRRLARILPMNTDTLNLNTLAGRPAAYWTAEYASKSTSSADFGRVTLTPQKLVCLLPVSEELLADANINLVNFIVELFAEEIGRTEDKAYFTGSGSGQPRGINQETLTTVSAGGALTFDHVIALTDSVPQRSRTSPRAGFVCNSYVIRILRQIKDSQNRYIWEPSVQVGTPERILGKPVYEQNDISQDEIYYGDWANYIIGDRHQLSVRTTMEGGDAWRRDSMEIKAKIRVDGKAVLTAPFAKINTI